MKKIIAILLALVMLVPMCLASCDNGSTLPPPDTDDDTQGNEGGDTTGGGSSNGGTQNNQNSAYVPDPTASFAGWFGIAAEEGTVYFDDIKGTGTQGKKPLFEMTFDEEGANLDLFTLTEASEWTIVDEPVIATEDEAEEADAEDEEAEDAVANKVLQAAGKSMAKFGGVNWNRAQIAMKIMITEGAGGVKFYFGYVDENNYYVVNIGGADNSTINLTSVKDGTATVDTIVIPYSIPVGEWTPASVVLNADTVTVYVGGVKYFEAYAEVAAYTGGIGFGTWSTSYSIDNIKVTTIEDGTVLYENDFTNTDLSGWQTYKAADGAWDTIDNWAEEWVVAADTAEGSDHGNIFQCVSTAITGGGMFLTESLGNPDWTNYIFEFDARKDGGAEGFMPYFAVSSWADPSVANYIRWNQGGWANTLTCYQVCTNGSLANQTQVSDVYNVGEWYHVTIRVEGNVILGYVNGELLNIYIG